MRAHALVASFFTAVLLPLPAGAGTEARSRLPLFGPETFTRTSKDPNTFTRSFTSPTINGRFYLTVANGDGFGFKLSSGTITLNGTPVFVPSDFNQTVVRLRREVTILSTNELVVEIASNPGSYWAIGVDGDVPESVLPHELRDRSGVGSFFSQTFVGTAPESTESVSVSVPVATGRFDLEVTNGFGLERVTSARVFINGVEVVRPQDLNESVDFLRVPVVVNETEGGIHLTQVASMGCGHPAASAGTVPPTSPWYEVGAVQTACSISR